MNRSTYVAQVEDQVHGQIIAASEFATLNAATIWLGRRWKWLESQHPAQHLAGHIHVQTEWIDGES
jgi:hypothetical protein